MTSDSRQISAEKLLRLKIIIKDVGDECDMQSERYNLDDHDANGSSLNRIALWIITTEHYIE